MSITHDTLDLTIHGTPPKTSSWDLAVQGPLSILLEMLKLVHYEARTVGKWVVGRNAFVSSRLLGYFGMAEFYCESQRSKHHAAFIMVCPQEFARKNSHEISG